MGAVIVSQMPKQAFSQPETAKAPEEMQAIPVLGMKDMTASVFSVERVAAVQRRQCKSAKVTEGS